MAFDVDFRPIGNLAKTYDDARTRAVRERTLAELGQHFAGGDIDYRGLGAKLFALGEPRTGITALHLGEQREALRRMNASAAGSSQALNTPRAAAPLLNPPPTHAPPMTGMPPALGARQGADGYWYVEDPARPGQYLKVDP